MDPRHIRAVRNNNPGNIKIGTAWFGLMQPQDMTAEQKAEKVFCVFSQPVWGFRAMAEIVKNYHRLHKLSTLRDIIYRWTATDRESYLSAVSHRIGILPDAAFPFGSSQKLADLLHAMSIQEVGVWAFKEDDLLSGVTAAH